VAPWITVLSRHSIHKEGDILQIYYCVIFCETRHHAQAHITSGALIHNVPFLWPREEHRWQSSWVDFAGQCLLWLLLLRLAAVVVPLLLPPQNSLLTSIPFAPDSESVSVTRISLMASSSSFIYLFFLATARHPQSSALFRLLCMTRHSSRNVIPVRYEWLLQWQQNRSKATMWLNYMGTVCHWQPFWSTTRVCFIGQCWYFNPQWTPE